MTFDETELVDRNQRNFYLYLAFLWCLAVTIGALVAARTEWTGLNALATSSRNQASRYGNALEREISRFGLVPLTLSLDDGIAGFLAAPRDDKRTMWMNHHLKSVNGDVGALRTYLVDRHGRIAASSNWDYPDSFIGRDISYRPYFQQARPARVSRYYAIGTTGNASGYYMATEVRSQGQRVGVVAVKVGLEQLEHLWHGEEKPVLLTDANNVVVLTSEPEWKYRVYDHLSAAQKQRFATSQQYNQHALLPLDWRTRWQLSADTALVTAGKGGLRKTWLGITHPLPGLSMKMTVLADPYQPTALALALGASAALVVALAMAVLHALNQWRLSIRERLASQASLQDAKDHLEVLVEQRNAELVATNEDLRREVAERTQAVRQQQAFQQELIRTENLAVIGQLSAGLAHEINQPLAALGTLSANSLRFLERGDLTTVGSNLDRIIDLVARLGALTGQLHSFARRSSGELTEAPLAASIDNAIALLGHHMGKSAHSIALSLHPPAEAISVRCEPIRLEQVLVNLISNAIDATAECTVPRIDIDWGRDVQGVYLRVADNGTGLSEKVLARLFEPFFTTKSTSGLGLGLAISADIVRGFGGELSPHNVSPGPGAAFVIRLPDIPTSP